MDVEKDILPIIHSAGTEILKVYNSGNLNVSIKSDNSPLTEADQISHEIITEELRRKFHDVPIISEEGSSIELNVRSKWKRYFLIDPLDGTKEFLKRNGEFTVNIALIENNRPSMGMIHIPVEKKTFWGERNKGMMQYDNGNIEKLIENIHIDEKKILVSRSHKNSQHNSIVGKIREDFNVKILEMGSSKKFCALVDDKSIIYPRFGPTSEWDIAAGHAMIESMGGIMTRLNGKEIIYNSGSNFIVDDFIAGLDKDFVRSIINAVSSY